MAAQSGHAAAVELLASSGADLDKPNSQGATPAFYAAMDGHLDVLAVLRDAGADLTAAAKCASSDVGKTLGGISRRYIWNFS